MICTRHKRGRDGDDLIKPVTARRDERILKTKGNAMENKNENKRVSELETALREALSGIDEFMTRTIYRVHGEDIERWRKALEGASND